VASALDGCGPDDEVVVVDDGSTDGAPESLPSHPRLRVLRQGRRGIVPALERGRVACRGWVIARLDADDRALPGRLEWQVAAFDADPGLVAVGGRARLEWDGNDPPQGMIRYVDWINGLADPHRELLVESPLLHPATSVRAEAVAEVGGYRDTDRPEDYDLWLRLVAAGHRITNVPHEVVVLRDHPERLTRTDSRYRREAFDRCRKEYLVATSLSEPRTVVLWAGRRGGRPWVSWLQEQGHEVSGIVDVGERGRRRRGVSVVGPDDLRDLPCDLLLVAVGRRGAREEIRESLARIRPDLMEGRDWFAVL